MLLLLLAITQSTAFASERAPATDCAKVSLSAIYSAEKAYHAEYDKFSESYQDIGFEPDLTECKDWEGSLRVFNGGQEFLATYTKSSTGESWTINEKKELHQD